MKNKFPIWVLAVIVSILAVVNGAADYWHLYYFVWWLDIPMHLLGGFWVGLMALVLYYSSPHITHKDVGINAVFIIAISSAIIIGIGWELFEWGTSKLTGTLRLDLVDTLADISNDIIGATIAGVIFARKGYNK